MGIRKMALVAAIGAAMAASPVVAQTSFIDRSAAVLQDANGQEESSTSTYIIAFFVVVAIGLGIYTATQSDDDGQTSP